MVSTEIYIEDYKLDLSKELSTEFTYAIDDIMDFGSKNTSFSKTINIAGNSTNNRVFGFVFDLGNSNFTDDTLPNVNYNYNAAKAAQCRIFIDKIQVFKGTLRILEIIVDGKAIEYQCTVFGELGGFITALGSKKLIGNDNPSYDLDFSIYNHTYNHDNIIDSWEVSGATAGDRGVNNSLSYGSGYYYPLIDYGTYRNANNRDYNVLTFRPALFVKEYLEKIFEGSGYDYDFPLLNTDPFKRLIIPHNQKKLTKITSTLNVATKTTEQIITGSSAITFDTVTGSGLVASSANSVFTYTGSTSINLKMNYTFDADYLSATFNIYKNNIIVYTTNSIGDGSFEILMNTNDAIVFRITNTAPNRDDPPVTLTYAQVSFFSGSIIAVSLNYNDDLVINDTIPRGIFQKDFFLSICKMYNLYVYDDIFNDKKIYIKPYIDFYPDTSANALDWSEKIDRSKPLSIKPMSELNARYYQYKYKDDSDYYNENYKKKYNQNYGDRLYDTNYDFSKDTESLEIIFASSPLIQLAGEEKRVTQIFKLSNENTKEDQMDSVIRIMQVQKITGVHSWKIRNQSGTGDLHNGTVYGYAGHLHFNDAGVPDQDINFGVPKEVYISTTSYPTTNLFNAYHSEYIAEITSKDSKLLTCTALLNTLDINNLDFSKYIWIDGVLFRLNTVEGYNPMEYNTTKISLLKVIETTY
jgi:hypothetical protein